MARLGIFLTVLVSIAIGNSANASFVDKMMLQIAKQLTPNIVGGLGAMAAYNIVRTHVCPENSPYHSKYSYALPYLDCGSFVSLKPPSSEAAAPAPPKVAPEPQPTPPSARREQKKPPEVAVMPPPQSTPSPPRREQRKPAAVAATPPPKPQSTPPSARREQEQQPVARNEQTLKPVPVINTPPLNQPSYSNMVPPPHITSDGCVSFVGVIRC